MKTLFVILILDFVVNKGKPSEYKEIRGTTYLFESKQSCEKAIVEQKSDKYYEGANLVCAEVRYE